MLESEPVTVTGCLQPRCSVDEDNRVVDEMFLAEFREEHLDQRLCSRRKEPHVPQAIRRGIDGSVQPVLLAIELNHGFVNRNAIRISTVCRL
jgi:DNA polymerase IIIc chi subunit